MTSFETVDERSAIAQFEAAYERAARVGAPTTLSLVVAGERVDLSFADCALETALAPSLARSAGGPNSLRHLGESPAVTRSNGATASPTRTPFRLFVWDSESSGVALPFGSRLAVGHGRRPAPGVQSFYHELGIGHETMWGLSLYDPARRAGGLWVKSLACVPWWERAAPFRTLWQWVLARDDRCLAHAAAVGSGAAGVLLVGPGGSGKSTTAIAAALDGMSIVGEDYVALENASAGPIAHALYSTTKLTAATAVLLPELSGLLDEASGVDGEKLVLSLDTVAPRARRASLPIVALVVPRTGAASSSLVPISAGAALLALAPSTVLQLPAGGAAAFAPIAAVVRRLPCYRLELGPRPRDAVACLRAVVTGGR